MTEQYIGWAVVVGMALGAAVTFFVTSRLPRSSEDIGPDERAQEAEWISGVIARRGGMGPVELVEEVLELHAQYLELDPEETLRRRGSELPREER